MTGSLCSFSKATVRLILAIAACAGVYSAANGQTVEGWVRIAETHAPLRDAFLTLVVDSSNVLVDSTRTDAAGVFYLSAPAPGTYRVEIRSAAGYAKAEFSAPAMFLPRDSTVQRELLIPTRGLIGYQYSIEKPVVVKGVPVLPQYPPDLKRDGIEGEVAVQFVVNKEGKAVPSSIKVLHAGQQEFVFAVRDAVLRSEFYPATIDGRPVNQLVQRRFVFAMGCVSSR